MDWLNTIYFSAFGQTLIHSLWQGVLIALLYFIAKQLFIEKPGRFRFHLAAAALMMQFIFSIATFMIILSSNYNVNHLIEGTRQIGNSLILTNPMDEVSTNWMMIVGALWLTGSIFFIFRFGLGWWQTNQIRSKGVLLSNYWQGQCSILASKMGVSRKVKLLSTKSINVPFTIGTLKPVILFPVGLINQLSLQEVEAILAHELAHIKYNDYVINLFFSFVESLFYFHPVVWWLSLEMNAAREESCDELAISTLGNRVQYARTLVNVQEKSNHSMLTAMSITGKKGLLHQRIFKILRQPYPIHASRNKQIGFITLGIIMCFFFMGSIYANQEKEVDNEIVEEQLTESQPSVVFSNEEVETTNAAKTNTTINVLTSNEVETSTYPNNERTVLVLTAGLSSIGLDTIPEKKRANQDYNFSYSSGLGKKTKIKIHNDQIKYLMIEGVVIPEEEYDNYTEEIEAIRATTVAPPAPPVPPMPPSMEFDVRSMPEMPSMPPAPPTPTFEFEDELAYQMESLRLDSILNGVIGENFDNENFQIEIENLSDEKMEKLNERMQLYRERIEQYQASRQEDMNKQMEEYHIKMEEFHNKMEGHQSILEEQLQERFEAIESQRTQYENELNEYALEREERLQDQIERMKAKKKKELKKTTKKDQKRK